MTQNTSTEIGFARTEQDPAEALLGSWLHMTYTIRGNRFLESLSLNSMAILNLLQQVDENEPGMTASELIRQTGLLKSQMNKELASLKDKGIVESVENAEDGRSVYNRITQIGRRAYKAEHDRVMTLLHRIEEALGTDETRRLAVDLKMAIDVATMSMERDFVREH